MAKKFTTEDFILKAKEIYEDMYTYEKSIYKSLRKDKIIITCPIHGDFERTPDAFLNKLTDCPECRKSISKITNTKEVILRAKERHLNYIYDKTIFINSRSKVTVTCPIHGDFEISPTNLVKGGGCQQCHDKRFSQEEFIQKVKEIHGENNIDFSKVIYKNSFTHITLICKNCNKEYQQLPQNTLKGRGCPHCCGAHKVTLEEWIQRSIKSHPLIAYNYDKVQFNKLSDEVVIGCPKHGDFFIQNAGNHMRGANCSICNMSKGELLVEEYLKTNNFIFEKQKIFYCDVVARFTNKLVVDFYLELNNQKFIIEFNGKQHYIYNEFYYKTEEEFEKQKK